MITLFVLQKEGQGLIVVIAILTLLRPQIGNVFSEIVNALTPY